MHDVIQNEPESAALSACLHACVWSEGPLCSFCPANAACRSNYVPIAAVNTEARSAAERGPLLFVAAGDSLSDATVPRDVTDLSHVTSLVADPPGSEM